MDPESKSSRFKETKVLGFVIVVLVCLYVLLTAYVMRTNQTIGSTQIDYSKLHTTQLKQLQDQLLLLDNKISLVKDSQENFAAVMTIRLNRLESAAILLSNAMMLAESTRQGFAAATAAHLDALHKELAGASNSFVTVAQDHNRLAAGLGAQLTDVQNRLTGAGTALATIERQQGLLASSLPPQLTELQKNLNAVADAQARWEETQLLARQLDRLQRKAKALDQITEENLPDAAALWQQARLAIETGRSAPPLTERVNALATEVNRLQPLLANAVAAAVRKQHHAAQSANTPEERQAALTKAGQLLGLFPLASDPALTAAGQKLAAEHEALLQQLSAAAPAKK